jgi:hypothetical protein
MTLRYKSGVVPSKSGAIDKARNARDVLISLSFNCACEKVALSIKVDKTDKVGDRRNVNAEGSCRGAVRSFSGIPFTEHDEGKGLLLCQSVYRRSYKYYFRFYILLVGPHRLAQDPFV